MHLEEYLYEKNLSIRQFGKKADIDRRTIRDIIQGRDFFISTAIKICDGSDNWIFLDDLVRNYILKQETKNEGH